jgi:hypothetical protein
MESSGASRHPEPLTIALAACWPGATSLECGLRCGLVMLGSPTMAERRTHDRGGRHRSGLECSGPIPRRDRGDHRAGQIAAQTA